MLARELIDDYPLIRADDPALAAARMIGEQRLPGLMVVDDGGRPLAVIGGSQVLRFMLPGYVVEDPTLARVMDEKLADHLSRELEGKTVADLLPDKPAALPQLGPDDTVMEIASVMARERVPLVAIVNDEQLVGVVTASKVFSTICPAL